MKRKMKEKNTNNDLQRTAQKTKNWATLQSKTTTNKQTNKQKAKKKKPNKIERKQTRVNEIYIACNVILYIYTVILCAFHATLNNISIIEAKSFKW